MLKDILDRVFSHELTQLKHDVRNLRYENDHLRHENTRLEHELSRVKGRPDPQLVALEERNRFLAKELEHLGQGRVLGSKHRHHFHRESCKWLKYVSERWLIEFETREEAIAAGRRPCKTCCA